MNFNYKIFDDLLTEEEKDKIESLMFKTPWGYLPNITLGNNNPNNNIKKFLKVDEYFLEKDRVGFSSDILSPLIFNEFFSPLVSKSCNAISYKVEKIFRGNSFLQLPLQKTSSVGQIHVNRKENHLVLLYYVNDCDGDTVLFDKTFYDIPFEENYPETKYVFNELKRVTPKRGRILLFDGKIFHASSSPTNNHRCVVTFDVSGSFTNEPKNAILIKKKFTYK